MNDIDKVRDLLRKCILRLSTINRTPVKTTPFSASSPTGILFSDGMVALFDGGKRVFSISGVIAGEYSVRALLACEVLFELGLISESESKAFARWLKDESELN